MAAPARRRFACMSAVLTLAAVGAVRDLETARPVEAASCAASTTPDTFGSQYSIGNVAGDFTGGLDGNLWLADGGNNDIAKVTTAGVVTTYTIPTPSSDPRDVAQGPDGNLWFTEYAGSEVGKVTTAGAITEYPTPTTSSTPRGITAGPDGNLWFTEFSANNRVGRVTTAGVITEFQTPTANSNPWDIVSGPDGNLWFTEYGPNKIGKVTTAGVVTEYPTPTTGSNPQWIASGPDGNLWFTENSANMIGKITTAGVITEYSVPTASSRPQGIVAGPDGNLWFSENSTNKLGQVTTAGTITEYTIPIANSTPQDVVAGPDGNLWFSTGLAHKIGLFFMPASLSVQAPPGVPFGDATLNGVDQTLSAQVTLTSDDTRSTNPGWNLTATSTQFSAGNGHLLPTGATTVTAASVQSTATTCVLGTNQITYPVTLPAGATPPAAAKLADASNGTGTGQENIALTFNLAVPANAYAGSYSSTWTFSIASGP